MYSNNDSDLCVGVCVWVVGSRCWIWKERFWCYHLPPDMFVGGECRTHFDEVVHLSSESAHGLFSVRFQFVVSHVNVTIATGSCVFGMIGLLERSKTTEFNPRCSSLIISYSNMHSHLLECTIIPPIFYICTPPMKIHGFLI